MRYPNGKKYDANKKRRGETRDESPFFIKRG